MPGLEAAQDRLRVSWEALTASDASPVERRDLAWLQALLPNTMGGGGLYDALSTHTAAYAAARLKTWPTLRRISPLLADVDFNTTDMPSVVAAREAYETLRALRADVAARHATFDDTVYYTIDGDRKLRFRPASLPLDKSLPPLAQLWTPVNDSLPTPPSQKVLSKVIQHDKWLTLLDAAIEFDRTAVDTPIHHREATRIISASQFGAGSWLGASPDASPSCPKLHSPAHLIMLQRRLGLYLSAAKTANDALSVSRDKPDRRLVDYLGDLACNSGEHSTRHHATNRAWRDACAAVAIGAVILGDKEKADEYKQYNADHVSDIVQPGASAWHTDWLGENKVASPLCTSHSPNARAGRVQNVGHLFAFGNTEERLHRDILGCRERDRPADPPFDHNTGKGHVAFHKGDYYDAIYNKNNHVVPLIVEVFGGIASRGARYLRFLARRASDRKRGRDGTAYSDYHASGGFLAHHLARISMAAVYWDAQHIDEGVRFLKQHAQPHA